MRIPRKPLQHYPIPQELLDSAALRYRGGYTQDSGYGYVREYNPFHRCQDRRGLVPQHRLVMERSIGRLLKDREVVHHKNSDRSDNRLENLQLERDQSAHMKKEWRSGHRKSKRYNPELVRRVRKAAANPNTKQSGLTDVSPVTVGRICKLYGIKWASAKKCHLTDKDVEQALQGRSTAEAAKHLGVCQQTIYNLFDHLLPKRIPPNYLDPMRDEVERCASEHGVCETSRRFGCHRVTVASALKRWKAQDASVGEPAHQ